ncbi:hypothetical protein ACLHDD_05370 [Pantoea sp. NSTU24]|uniref:hypothetical protein n=1 Tax=Pantoea sp. NSTU24 TaxID=3391144 RepID=UPI003CFCBBB7
MPGNKSSRMFISVRLIGISGLMISLPPRRSHPPAAGFVFYQLERPTPLLRNKTEGEGNHENTISLIFSALEKTGDVAQRQIKTLRILKLQLKFCFNDSTDRYRGGNMPG